MKRAGQGYEPAKRANTQKRGYSKLNRRLPAFTSRPATRGGYFPSVGELKVKDNNLTIEANTTGTFTLINGLTQGADFTQRVGRKVVWKSLYVRYLLQHDRTSIGAAVGVSPNSSARVIVFVDLQANGAAPSVLNLLAFSSTTSPLNLDNRDRFRILMDKLYCFPGVSKTATDVNSAGNTAFAVKKYRKIDIETIFNANNIGNIGDITIGAIYMFILGDQTTGDNCSTLNGNFRLRFADP